MKRPYKLRARTAFFIAAAFTLLLSLFAIVSYFAIEHALVSRVDNEARGQLLAVLTELDNGGSFDTLQSVNRHRSIGEAKLDVWLFERSGDSLQLVWSDLPKSAVVQNTIANVAKRESSFEIRMNGERTRFLSIHSQSHSVVAAMDLVVISEAEEAILRTFLFLLLIGIVLSAALGYAIAGLSLAPIALLIKSARKLEFSAGAGETLLPVPERVLEVALLANAVNKLITERDRSIIKLQTFTADAAHELRTPLTVLKGELEVELRLTSTDDKSCAIFQSNLEEVERLIAIVQDLLLLANFDESSLRPEPPEMDAIRAIERVVERLVPLASERSIDIKLQMSGAVIVRAEPDRFERMIYNLLHNAITYSETGSSVSLSVIRTPGSVCIAIEDSGPGIDESELPFVFDRFYRTERARNRRSGGAGLGLAIVRSIAGEYSFRIELRSTPGAGTAVHIFL